MPHLEYTKDALDIVYPSLVPAQNVPESEELNWDSWDKVLARGEEIVKEIRERTISDGRRRWHGTRLPKAARQLLLRHSQCESGRRARHPLSAPRASEKIFRP